jgi:hypothetical protein
MAFDSPHIAECPHKPIAFAADPIVDAHHYGVAEGKPKPDPTCIIGSSEIELGSFGSHFPHLNKDGRVPIREKVPAVLDSDEKRALVVEPITLKPSEQVVSAKRGLQVKWDGLPVL